MGDEFQTSTSGREPCPCTFRAWHQLLCAERHERAVRPGVPRRGEGRDHGRRVPLRSRDAGQGVGRASLSLDGESSVLRRAGSRQGTGRRESRNGRHAPREHGRDSHRCPSREHATDVPVARAERSTARGDRRARARRLSGASSRLAGCRAEPRSAAPALPFSYHRGSRAPVGDACAIRRIEIARRTSRRAERSTCT
jgi:hypothetical protein